MNSTREDGQTITNPLSGPSQTIAGLSPEKRALLEKRLLERRLSPVKKSQSLTSGTSKSISFSQESLWFMDQLEPDSPFYNIPQAIRLIGELNISALQKTLATIVQRHETLRTNFISENGKPSLTSATKPFVLQIVNLSEMEPAKRNTQAEQLVDEEAKRPFDLASDLMLRATLIKLSVRENILLLTMHHIASDLWSFSVLYSEIAALYKSFSDGTVNSLPEIQISFAEIAAQQRSRFQGELFDKQLAYWKQQLAGELPVLELPTDRPRPAQQTFRGARQTLKFPILLLSGLKEFSRKEGATLYMTLLAAFQTLLHRYSNQEEIIIGSPINGRNHPEAEKLIGYFVSTLPMRANFSKRPTFRELLQQTHKTVLGAFANQEMPVERIVEELKIPRHSGRNPLFQAIFQFLTAPPPPLVLAGVTSEILPMESGTAKFDLTFTLVESTEGIVGDLEYNSDLFDRATIDQMIANFQTLLEGIVIAPDQRVENLPLLTKSEREKVLQQWNNTTTDYPRASSIQKLFEEQVEKNPEAVALIFGEQKLSYRELNERANQLAHYLQKKGVGPDVLVGICLDRSLEMVVGLLAILKAGGAYVPLDSNYPAERLAYMFADTKTPILITEKKFKYLAPEKAEVICFDENNDLFSQESRKNPTVKLMAENLAYVMYTSGSTGQPKGVSIPHRGVVRLVKNTNFMTFSADDTFLQFAPISFDASTLEIWGPLLNGAKLVIFPPGLPSLELLGETLLRHQISVLWLTAGLFHQMVEHHISALQNVRQLLAGGDVLSVPHVVKVLRELPDCQLINGYGPTENTTFTCCYRVPKNWNGERSVPIGTPISNTQVYILDKNLSPVPIGVSGELFIGGDGLAREYLNSPELTAQKFISNPFAPGGKLYRTGDSVRYLSDGTIEFIGRIDHQVKIRGFRIELGEIETILAQHEKVRESIVIARDTSGGKQLVAYVVPKAETKLATLEVRTFLEAKFPGYMVPSHFVLLEELPLTANGKVDRKALPSPDENFEPGENFVAPRNADEEHLSRIWSEVLEIKQVGVHDNFFELGGHSLLATQIISRVGQAFATDLPLRTLFESPTIAALAEAIQQHKNKPSADHTPIMRRQRGSAKTTIIL